MVNHPARSKAKGPKASERFENVRELLETLAEWLAVQNEDLAFGLRSIDDVVKLYDAHHASEIDVYPDHRPPGWRRKILGYDPIAEYYKKNAKRLHGEAAE